MAKYNFIYCNKCEDFYLSWSTNFIGQGKKACPNIKCFTHDIVELEADSLQEMAQIERMYKVRKITDK